MKERNGDNKSVNSLKMYNLYIVFIGISALDVSVNMDQERI